jgi:hypothetical protein
MILIGLAVVAVVGTGGYAIWIGEPDRLFAQLCVFVIYLPPPYFVLYLLSPTMRTDGIALVDRVCATLAAVGLLGFWGWFVTVPLTPQNAQAPIGLFMIGWTGAGGFYGAFKIAAYAFRRMGDQ